MAAAKTTNESPPDWDALFEVAQGQQGYFTTAQEWTEAEFLRQMFSECDEGACFEELSVVELDWWPLVAVASRHHRSPRPLHFVRGFQPQKMGTGDEEEPAGAEDS